MYTFSSVYFYVPNLTLYGSENGSLVDLCCKWWDGSLRRYSSWLSQMDDLCCACWLWWRRWSAVPSTSRHQNLLCCPLLKQRIYIMRNGWSFWSLMEEKCTALFFIVYFKIVEFHMRTFIAFLISCSLQKWTCTQETTAKKHKGTWLSLVFIVTYMKTIYTHRRVQTKCIWWGGWWR